MNLKITLFWQIDFELFGFCEICFLSVDFFCVWKTQKSILTRFQFFFVNSVNWRKMVLQTYSALSFLLNEKNVKETNSKCWDADYKCFALDRNGSFYLFLKGIFSFIWIWNCRLRKFIAKIFLLFYKNLRDDSRKNVAHTKSEELYFSVFELKRVFWLYSCFISIFFLTLAIYRYRIKHKKIDSLTSNWPFDSFLHKRYVVCAVWCRRNKERHSHSKNRTK